MVALAWDGIDGVSRARARHYRGGWMSATEHTAAGVRRDASSAAVTRVVLTIAGSDSGGGAGIQADLKAFAACDVHGACAITAVTAQDTMAVHAVHPLAPDVVLAQARAVIADLGVDAVKVGMLASEAAALAVAQLLQELPEHTHVVVDPVIAASSGAHLLDQDALRILTRQILPRASVITPNVPEALTLMQWSDGAAGSVRGEEEKERELVLALGSLGARAVVLTGGHRSRPVDLFWERSAAETIVEIPGERHEDGADHGSGCTHSAVLAAELAKGSTPLAAARRARELAGQAIAAGRPELGAGCGPVDILRARRGRREL
jgi:hydroxymethylpyrimidine/phosphomethylpyrimidine kinase